MTGTVGVAISTTGEPHRLAFLETAAAHWWRALAPLGLPTTVIVTVDGTHAEAAHVAQIVNGFAEVYRVGQPRFGVEPYSGRMGVATNKNTGIELLMERGVEHLFLSDDDCHPKFSQSVTKHIDFDSDHSMVCWGKSRLVPDYSQIPYSVWNWPRGVMLYTHSNVIRRVGGMDERFRPGGHEHVEWSRRIHQAGFTRSPFISPASYATRNGMGAAALWHCEDMRQPNETPGRHQARRRHNTTVHRADGDWAKINAVMAERDGDTSFVPYRAEENGRASATLYPN